MVAQALEGLALVDAVALHEHALRALDHRPALERALELPDLVVEQCRLAVAADRHLDRRLHVLGVVGRDVGRDPALRGTRDEVDVALAQLRDHRPRRQLHRLAYQREYVLVIAVDDDDGEVRVLADDQLGRLLYRDGERHHLMAELGEDGAEALERLLVLVGEQHAQVGRPQGADGRRGGHGLPNKVVRTAGEIAVGRTFVPEHPDVAAGMQREMTSVEFIDDHSDLERDARHTGPTILARRAAEAAKGGRAASALPVMFARCLYGLPATVALHLS